MRHRLARIGLVALLTLAGGSAVACDKEDVKDAEEIGNDIDNEVDKLDSDGKDD